MLASSVAVCEESLQSFSQCRDVIMQREKQLWKKEGETVGRIVFSFRRFHCASQRTPTHLLSEIRSLLWTNTWKMTNVVFASVDCLFVENLLRREFCCRLHWHYNKQFTTQSLTLSSYYAQADLRGSNNRNTWSLRLPSCPREESHPWI